MNDYVDPYFLMREMVKDDDKSVREIARATGYSYNYVATIRRRTRAEEINRSNEERARRIDAINERKRESALIRASIYGERSSCMELVNKHIEAYSNLEQTPTTKAALTACIEILEGIKNRGKQ